MNETPGQETGPAAALSVLLDRARLIRRWQHGSDSFFWRHEKSGALQAVSDGTKVRYRLRDVLAFEGGYTANIEFHMAPGAANTIGTPDAHPLPTHRDAFLVGAAIVCEIVTGSPELPFLVLEDEIMVATVTSRGVPFLMRRPFPKQCTQGMSPSI